MTTQRATFWLSYLLFLWTLCVFCDAGTYVDHLYVADDTVTRTDAKSTCTSDGHFVNGSEISRDQLRRIGAVLQNGESAWVSNIADFSKFAAYVKCYPAAAFLGKTDHVIDENSFYKCSQACRNYGTSYVGLQNNNCYCIYALPQPPFLDKWDATCNYKCNSSFGESCGDDASIAVYEIVDDEKVIGFGSDGPGFDQCVMLRKEMGKDIMVFTKSCGADCKNCAYICKVPGETECKFIDVCLTFGTMKYTWHSADVQCTRNDDGYLYHPSADGHYIMESYLVDTFRFWTGYFRTFEMNPTKIYPSVYDSCVAIRKSDGMVRFEATKCSEKKKYICYWDTPPTVLPDVTNGPVTMAHEGTDDAFPYWLIIVIVVGGILLILLIILIISCVIRRNRRKRTYHGDFRDTRSIISTATSGSRARYGFADSELDVTMSHVSLTPTLDLDNVYDAEWRRGVNDSPLSSRSTARLSPNLPATDMKMSTFRGPNGTLEKAVDRGEKIIAVEPKDVYRTEFYFYPGYPKGKGPNGFPQYSPALKRAKATEDDVIYAKPNKDLAIERPIRTYLDYMYDHLKLNIEQNQL